MSAAIFDIDGTLIDSVDFHAKASRAIVIGDSPYDAIAAGRTGVSTIGVLCGGFPEDDLRQAGCIAIFRDPADILERFPAFEAWLSPMRDQRIPASQSAP